MLVLGDCRTREEVDPHGHPSCCLPGFACASCWVPCDNFFVRSACLCRMLSASVAHVVYFLLNLSISPELLLLLIPFQSEHHINLTQVPHPAPVGGPVPQQRLECVSTARPLFSILHRLRRHYVSVSENPGQGSRESRDS